MADLACWSRGDKMFTHLILNPQSLIPMLLIISPAKTLDSKPLFPKGCKPSQPEFLGEAKKLVSIMREYSPADIRGLMGVSEKLAGLNYVRFQHFTTPFTSDNATPALTTFKGDVYAPLDVEGYTKSQWAYVNKHLRILSGLYGLLRPLDLMQPYRLEMGTSLKNKSGKDLYAFWGDRISKELNRVIHKGQPLVNLASNEYFKAIDQDALNAPMIDIVFKDKDKQGNYKIIGIKAKRARGLMVDYAVRHHIENAAELKEFDSEGYAFCEKESSDNAWVFLRG